MAEGGEGGDKPSRRPERNSVPPTPERRIPCPWRKKLEDSRHPGREGRGGPPNVAHLPRYVGLPSILIILFAKVPVSGSLN